MKYEPTGLKEMYKFNDPENPRQIVPNFNDTYMKFQVSEHGMANPPSPADPLMRLWLGEGFLGGSTELDAEYVHRYSHVNFDMRMTDASGGINIIDVDLTLDQARDLGTMLIYYADEQEQKLAEYLKLHPEITEGDETGGGNR